MLRAAAGKGEWVSLALDLWYNTAVKGCRNNALIGSPGHDKNY